MMVNYLVKPIKQSIRYSFRFRKIVQELHEQQKNLKREQTRVKEDVKEAELQIQTQVIEDYVDEWLTNAENALNDVQSLVHRVEENKRCFGLCPTWCWRYRLSKEIENKIVYISKLVEDSHFKRIGHRAELPALEFFTSKHILASKSSTAAFNKIMEALKDDKVNMIGVWGMGGVGKTTLVIEVGKKTKELRCFHKVIEVVVSQTSIIENIQHKIADFLNLKFEKTTKEGKAEELWLRLKKEEKVLIILDDMWNEVQLNEIGLPLNENGNGCKIILTTRRMTGCESMECQVIVPVDVLDNDEAWTLFRMKAYLDERVSRDIIETAKEVAKECKGLPVAIVTLAKALKGTKTVKGWEVARKKLERSRLMEVGNIEEEGEEKNAYLCIKMSYEYLKKETTKRCFLLCALYPEDHSIDMKHLVRYAWGLELFGKADSIEEVRIQVLEAIDYLKDSCLLLKDEDVERYVKLHNIVRDVALWIAFKEESGFLIKSRLELLNESFEPCKAISLLNREHKIFPEKLVHPNVEIMLLNDCDIQGTCFQGMKELKVLSLTSFSSCVISLYALTSLRKLRVLHLAFFEDLSYLGKLTTLEILSLRTTEFEGLADELVRLVNLKILDLTGCRFSSRFHPNVIRRLSKLEELYLKGSSIGEESDDILLEIKFLTRLTALSLSISSSHFIEDFEFPRLEEYNIFLRGTQDKLGCPHPEQWGKFLEEAARKISYEIQGLNSVVNLTKRSLKIEGVFPYNVVSQLLENLESLQVFDIKDEYIEGLTDQTQQIVSVSVILQNLKQVRIENCMNLEVVFQTEKVEGNEAPPLLSNLKSLRLKRLIDLSCIWELPTQHVRLESLVDLRIEDCPSLKSLFSVSLAQGLVLLEKLKIIGCGELKQIVTELEGDEEELSRSIDSHNSLCFPKLRKVHIENCDGLEYIFPTKIAAQGLRVSTLFIKNCCRLKQVIRVAKDMVENDIMFQQLQFLRSLSSFSVSGCPQITDSVVHLDAEEAHLEGIRLSAFKESFSGSKHLQLSEIEDQNLVPEANREGLNGLTSLELSQCKDLDCLVDTTTMNELTTAFTHLERLSINYMDGLESLCKGHPPQGFLKNLKELLIRDCNKLQVVLSMDELLYNRVPLSKLQSLELENLPDLRWLFKGSPHSFIFQSLKVVNIGGCGELKSLFSPSLIQSLVLLEKLQIRSCDELKTLLAEPENDDEMESKSSSLPLCLPNLKTLYIHHCSKLEYVVPITLAQGLPSLESVSISQCYELKQVFGMSKEQDGVQHDGLLLLASLQHLNLEWLLKLTSFVPQNYTVKAPALKRFYVYDCPQLMNSPIQHVHKKLELRLESVGLAAFKELFGNTINLLVHRVWDDKILIPDLENLEHHSQAMMGFKYNGEPSEGCFPNLKSLRVKNCVNLLKVFEIAEGLYNQEENQAPQILSKLEYLELYYLLDLRQIVKGPTRYVNLQSLKVLDIIRCSEPKSLFPLSVSQTLSSLEELNIHECGELVNVFMELEEEEKEEEDDDEEDDDDDDDDDDVDGVIESDALCLPNLKTVEITQLLKQRQQQIKQMKTPRA